MPRDEPPDWSDSGAGYRPSVGTDSLGRAGRQAGLGRGHTCPDAAEGDTVEGRDCREGRSFAVGVQEARCNRNLAVGDGGRDTAAVGDNPDRGNCTVVGVGAGAAERDNLR